MSRFSSCLVNVGAPNAPSRPCWILLAFSNVRNKEMSAYPRCENKKRRSCNVAKVLTFAYLQSFALVERSRKISVERATAEPSFSFYSVVKQLIQRS